MSNDLREQAPQLGSGAPELMVRRLSEQDRPLLEAFLAAYPGYSLFLSANLVYLRSNMDLVRYWGAYAGDRLAAVLMMVGRRAMISAEPQLDLSPLARIAAREQANFMMGQPEGVDALLGDLPPDAELERREEHYLAELALPVGRVSVVKVPPGVMIRRAHPSDLEALTTLYYRADGFESAGKDQVRRTMYGRIRSLRIWVAESQGQLRSAASTSAETAQAAMIGGVWTTPTARNRGYSTAVTAALSRELVAEGRRPHLFYLTNNVAAAHVYSQVGFSTIGRWSVIYLTPTRGSD